MMAFQSHLCFYATLFIHQTARILAMTRTDLRLTIHLLHRDDRDRYIPGGSVQGDILHFLKKTTTTTTINEVILKIL